VVELDGSTLEMGPWRGAWLDLKVAADPRVKIVTCKIRKRSFRELVLRIDALLSYFLL
jgi:hypothetical protein